MEILKLRPGALCQQIDASGFLCLVRKSRSKERVLVDVP